MEVEMSRYKNHFTKDCAGLTSLVAWLLDWSQKSRIKLRDKKTARRLGITVEKLIQLQCELRASGIYFCHRNQTSAWYGIHPTLSEIGDGTW